MFSWCWFELMINCSSTLCFLPTSSIFRKISICGLHYCWLQLLSCLGLVFVDLQSIYSTVDQGLRGELGLLFLARPAGQSVLIPAGRPARRV